MKLAEAMPMVSIESVEFKGKDCDFDPFMHHF